MTREHDIFLSNVNFKYLYFKVLLFFRWGLSANDYPIFQLEEISLSIHCLVIIVLSFQDIASVLQRPGTPGSETPRNQEPGTGTFNTSHKFWDQSLSSCYQCCLQISEAVSWPKLQCCYSYNMLTMTMGRDLNYFCKVNHPRISRMFSKKCFGLINLCEILPQNLRGLCK